MVIRMAANQKLVMNTRLILGITAVEVESAIAALNPEELLELIKQTDLYEDVKNRAADLNDEGVVYKSETDRRLIRQRISILLNIASLASGPIVKTATPFEADKLRGISSTNGWAESLPCLD